MTAQEFTETINSGIIIRCETTDERANLLRYMSRHGYVLGNTSATYLNINRHSRRCLDVGIELGLVTCFPPSRYAEFIYYEDVKSLVEDGIETTSGDAETRFYAAYEELLAVV